MKEEQKILERQLKNLPEGKLICAKNGTNSKWYVSDGHTSKYLPKKERTLAEKLALRRYLQAKLIDNKEQQNAIQICLNHYPSPDTLKSNEVINKSDFSDLISQYYKTIESCTANWMSEPYSSLTEFPEKLIYSTLSGYKVRSKSEALIANELAFYHIPTRYECELALGDLKVYPDFTCMRPSDGKVVYWEHLGLMDDPGYVQRNMKKIKEYIANDIIPTVDLILTYETKEHPLDLEYVHHMIKFYFLEEE